MALTGRAALLALLGVLYVGLVQPGWGGLGVWALVVLAAVVVDLLLAASPRAVRLEREPTANVRLGQPTSTALLVHHTGRRRLRGTVRDAWQPSAGAADDRHPLDVPSGERRRVRTDLVPTRRGDRLADRVTVRAHGPLGVAARQRSVPVPGSVRVLPPFTSRKHLPSRLARLREIDGRSSVNVRGQGTEFDSLRDYVPGDDVRSIDWRATARRRQVVVRTWRPERDRRVLIVLDTSRTAAARVGDQPRLDAAMDAALLLAALASRAGDRVDLLAVDRRVRARVEARSSTTLLSAVVEAMAPLEAEPARGRLGGRGLGRHRTAVAARARGAAHAARGGRRRGGPAAGARPGDPTAHGGGRVRRRPRAWRRWPVGATPPRTCTPLPPRSARRLDRDRVTRLLSRLGADVVDAPPDQLPPALADRYLALKAAGRL
ncbi:lipoprotein [Angustibacter aerolatus]|uniref:Lipoprotein n=1 Tax=Angustibacter aerolatus TaxID=1162965 RepID=A0ABQ6JNN4_9ACTN|nr:DUF58 domain-containing protein [Angustibacter aerolatus]GMA88442.1 lipoprotein [Angustibacter aerolatus]